MSQLRAKRRITNHCVDPGGLFLLLYGTLCLLNVSTAIKLVYETNVGGSTIFRYDVHGNIKSGHQHNFSAAQYPMISGESSFISNIWMLENPLV